MIAAAALLALVNPVEPAAVRSAADAMASAIPLVCVLHASGLSLIDPSRRKELAAVGLEYVDAPPAEFAGAVTRGMPAAWGKPHFSKVTWTNGSSWVVGFDNGECLIDASSDDGASLLNALHAQFETPGVPWQKLPPAAAPDRYGMAIQPPGKPSLAIIANMVGMNLSKTGRREIVTFDVTPNK